MLVIDQGTSQCSAGFGSIGLMAWAFCLFITSLALNIVIQVILRWASGLKPEVPFFPYVWDVIIGLVVTLSTLASAGAILLLIVTVLILPSDGTPLEPSFDVEFRPPAILTLVIVGCCALGIATVFAEFAGANGPRRLLRRERRKEWKQSKLRMSLEDYGEGCEKTQTGSKDTY